MRYEADPTAVSATILILPKDEYEFQITKIKPFERTARAGHQSYGLRCTLKVVNGPYDGRAVTTSLYMHSEGAQGMAKRFQMAAHGFTVKQDNEAKFNEAVAGSDWSFDPEDGSIGAAWDDLVGKHLVASVDVEKDDNGNDQQTWAQWMPMEGAAA